LSLGASPLRRLSVPLADGGQLSVAIRDDVGPTLVLVHGLTDCADSFRLLLTYLPGCRLIVPDLRGHGSSLRTGDLSITAFADDLSQMLDWLGIKETVLVGHSMGAMAATALASARPEAVQALVLLAGSLRPGGPVLLDLRRQMAALLPPLSPDDPFFATWHHVLSPVPPDFLACLARNAVTTPLSDWLAMIDMIADLDQTAIARRLTLPVLALSGRQDQLFPPDHLAHISNTFRHGSHQLIDHCGHNPHWEQPATVASAILDFLRASTPTH
jgi:pimeloyl-ACP methyl ester carboxylesterase